MDLTVALRAPCSLLRAFGDAPALLERQRDGDGPVPLGDGAVAWTPQTGDPAVFDAALAHGVQLLDGTAGRGAHRREDLRLFVSPAELELVDGRVSRLADDLAEDFRLTPPEVAAGAVVLTAHAAAMLEESWRLTPQAPYRCPSGKQVPLFRAEGAAEDRLPWRNPELLGRRVPWLPRPEVEERLRERAQEPVLRIDGPLGCGKTRLVEELLGRQESPHVSLRAQPARRGQSLARQLARGLLAPARPGAARFASEADRGQAAQRWQDQGGRTAATLAELLIQVGKAMSQAVIVVCDEAEKLAGEDAELLADLAELASKAVRLWLIGRPGAPPATSFEGAPQVWVGPLEPDEHRRLAVELTRGWAIPAEALEPWCRATAGHPFALEEGFVALARAQRMRHSWGTFSYAGEAGELPPYRPSSRLIAHLQAEVGRLSLAPQLLALAVAGTPVPASEIDAALGVTGEPEATWDRVASRAGLTRRVAGPDGAGTTLACPAYGRALEEGLTAATAHQLRLRLGARLSAGAAGGESAWQAYRLLKGSPQAVEPLLRSARGAGEPPGAELLAALVEELAALRLRGGDRETEILVLWRLFQTSRRLGRVHEFSPELERALELVRDEPERYLALVNLKAETEQEAGRYRDAERTLLAALEATRSLPRPERRASLMIRLGRTYQQAGRFADAERLFEDLYPALERHGARDLAATCRYNLGNLARRAHRLPEALGHHGAALEARRELGLALDTCASLTALGSLSAALGNYPKALRHYQEAVDLAGGTDGGERDLAYALLGKARVLGRIGDALAATALLHQARELRERREDRAGDAIARLALAQNLFDLGQEDRALEEASRARFDLELLSIASLLADADQVLGRIQLRRRRFDEARQHLSAAREAHLGSEDLEAAAFDEAALLEVALSTAQPEAARRVLDDLVERRARLERPELSERLDYAIFRALDWLAARQVAVEPARPYLERAYAQVLTKAGHLTPELRHRFLFEVPANRDIVEAATRLGIAG